ncbi:hypothetical protein ACFTWM_03340 [Streptomyces bacillaris]|uniref:Uncharacterized protein n=1 Tax=Streptomyces cavourensis TaxID=67258 RepID=A0AAD0Q8Y2_9ACTN|nr:MULTISPECIES: hypothetical protein [Streptomyces]PPA39364.1 hypothetical protein BF14_006145 [Streptomyces griseus]RAN16748.1 hypothetical protein A3838_05990 [Streptomyces badius]AWL85567.1 hypothetical protein DIJ69_06115 [Streptomyces globisporus]AXI74578.1 hypothetical protein DTW94_27275 [Streptomyces cavourensis]RAN24616.1 hypothetical protein A3800_05990 [Streptomyces badius]
MAKSKKVRDVGTTQKAKGRARLSLSGTKRKGKKVEPSATPHLDALSEEYFDESMLIHGQ